MLKDELFALKNYIDEQASKSENKLRKEILEKVLTKKLDRNYNNYVESLTLKINYILSKNNYRVIKALERTKEEQEKKKEVEEGDW